MNRYEGNYKAPEHVKIASDNTIPTTVSVCAHFYSFCQIFFSFSRQENNRKSKRIKSKHVSFEKITTAAQTLSTVCE